MDKCKTCAKEFELANGIKSFAGAFCSVSCFGEYLVELERSSPTPIKQFNDLVSASKKKRTTTRKTREFYKTDKRHLLKKLQISFNAFIRLRDQDKPCISCDATQATFHAGHFYSVQSRHDLRFNEDNVHKQCMTCNRHHHGNLLNYRKRLKTRIGKKRLDALEHKEKRVYSCEELLDLDKLYRSKAKRLKVTRETKAKTYYKSKE